MSKKILFSQIKGLLHGSDYNPDQWLDRPDILEKDIELTELFKISDALITDYSGVYYDYLLLDNIIGFTVDDFEEYKKKKGFVFDNIEDYMAGEKIKNIEDLYKFIDNVIKSNDLYKKERNEMKIKFNKYLDAKSSERLAKYLKL